MLLHPIWLFLAIPLLLSLWLWRMPSRLLLELRCLTLLLLLLALCGAVLRLPSRAGTIVVVADRSQSMPPGSATVQKEVIDLLQKAMGPDDRLAVVSFGRTVAVEQPPTSGQFAGFVHEIGDDASNLADGLEAALTLIPRDAPGKVLVLSDGRWSGRDPAVLAARAAARNLAIDYRSMQRSTANDLAIARVEAPAAVAPGESFLLSAWVHAPTPQTISFELRRGDQRLSAGEERLVTGLNRLTFRDRAGDPGTLSYTLTVLGSGDDPVPENNRARLLVGVQGPRPILHVTEAKSSGLARLLQAGRLPIEAKLPEACHWSLEELSKYSAVLIENVPAEKIGGAGMDNLAVWVRETGSGLMLTGGRNSYGTGGYFKSPLDPLLPVSMELRNEHRKLAVAMVVALDRSGSMSMPVGGGRAKMDLANEGAAQVLELLGPMDEFGVVAVDSAPHLIAPLEPVKNKETVKRDILSIRSQGGGIFIYLALESAAEMLVKAKAGTRHILLFADANDSEEPGRYEELVEKCRKAGITVSVIGLGTPKDKDAELLRDIAKRGNGRIFFTDKAEELPRLFAQDTFVVARNTFLDERTPIESTAGLPLLTGRPFDLKQSIDGYNLCYLREGATLATRTLDDYRAPVVAAWCARLRPRSLLHRRGRRQIRRTHHEMEGCRRLVHEPGALGRRSRQPPSRRDAADAGREERSAQCPAAPRSGARRRSIHRIAASDAAAFAHRPAAVGRKNDVDVDGRRHTGSRDSAARPRDGVGHGVGSGARAGGVTAGVFAVFAGVSAGREGSRLGDAGTSGPRQRRQRARGTDRHLEGVAAPCALGFVIAVAAQRRRGPVAARSVRAPQWFAIAPWPARCRNDPFLTRTHRLVLSQTSAPCGSHAGAGIPTRNTADQT